MQKITPFLWFDDGAEEAVNFYVSIFKNSIIAEKLYYDELSSKASGKPKGSLMTVEFQLEGQQFTALNGGPEFKFNQAISFFLRYKTEKDINDIFEKLSQKGEVLIPLGKSLGEKYAFFKDKFGIAWQIMLAKEQHPITPCLLFTGKNLGRCEEAIQFYKTVFRNSGSEILVHYKKGEEGKEGMVRHSLFYLEGQEFIAMDDKKPQNLEFNESISFVINCESQQEIDYYWNRLSGGGQTSVCGWLKDKYGVSWQVVPAILGKMLQDKDASKSKRVMEAMLKMTKIEINDLERAYK